MTELAIKMRTQAARDGLPGDHELRVLADRLDQATDGYFAEAQRVSVAQFLAAWAKARKAWCRYTGETLV